MTTETDILRRIMRACSQGAARLLRNNVGGLYDRTGAFVRYGLGVGTSDLIGWRTVIITPDMLGTAIAQFCAIEAKTDRGRPTKEQAAFIAAVRKAGGIAGIARNEQEAKTLLQSDFTNGKSNPAPSQPERPSNV